MTIASSTVIEQRDAESLRWGFVIVFVFIVADMIARNIECLQPFLFWKFYVTWEVASIFFTLIVTPIYWRKYLRSGEETAYSDVLLTADQKKFYLGLMISGSFAALLIAGLLPICIAYNQYRDTFNLELMLVFEAGSLALGVILLVFAELMVVTAAPEALKKAKKELATKKILLGEQTTDNGKAIAGNQVDECEKRAADYEDIADDIGKVLAFSDAPIAIAFFVIFILAFVNFLGWMGDGSALFSPFIAGAVTFQLLYSNFVFYIEANGAFPAFARKIMPKLELLTPMIQGYSTSVESRQGSIADSTVKPKPVVRDDDHSYTKSIQVEKE